MSCQVTFEDKKTKRSYKRQRYKDDFQLVQLSKFQQPIPATLVVTVRITLANLEVFVWAFTICLYVICVVILLTTFESIVFTAELQQSIL